MLYQQPTIRTAHAPDTSHDPRPRLTSGIRTAARRRPGSQDRASWDSAVDRTRRPSLSTVVSGSAAPRPPSDAGTRGSVAEAQHALEGLPYRIEHLEAAGVLKRDSERYRIAYMVLSVDD